MTVRGDGMLEAPLSTLFSLLWDPSVLGRYDSQLDTGCRVTSFNPFTVGRKGSFVTSIIIFNLTIHCQKIYIVKRYKPVGPHFFHLSDFPLMNDIFLTSTPIQCKPCRATFHIVFT